MFHYVMPACRCCPQALLAGLQCGVMPWHCGAAGCAWMHPTLKHQVSTSHSQATVLSVGLNGTLHLPMCVVTVMMRRLTLTATHLLDVVVRLVYCVVQHHSR